MGGGRSNTEPTPTPFRLTRERYRKFVKNYESLPTGARPSYVVRDLQTGHVTTLR
jgi:hypothetical protein